MCYYDYYFYYLSYVSTLRCSIAGKVLHEYIKVEVKELIEVER